MYGSSPPPPPPPKDLNRPFQPQQMSSGLLRYRSAPSSLLGEVCEDFLPIRATSPETETETETMFARFLPPENGGGHRNDSQFPPPPPPPPPPSTAAVVAETSVGFPSPCDLIYQAQNPVQTLIRQSSSPAGLFNNVENGGYNGVMRRGVMMMSNRNRNRNSSSSSSSSNYSNGEGGGGGGGGSSSRLKSQLSFSSSRQSSLLLSQISEIHENDSPTTTTPIGGGYHHHHPMPYSWEPESNHNHNHNNNNFSSPSSGGHGHGPTHNSNLQQNLHGDLGNGLTPHQFSMPKAASTSQGQMAAIHKLLQFQDSVPCKIRAKRGCATHPRSIAERARRTRISERMRKLQELVPNMDKQTNTADMLDLAVDYIKNLQKQVKTLSDSRASCSCSSSKQNPY